MCDYSLHGIANRLANEGEALVVHRFYSGSKGLTSPEYLKPVEQASGIMAVLRRMFSPRPEPCAVCIPDGARLILHGISPALQVAHNLTSSEAVTFRQLSADEHIHRDAVEFRTGVKVSLQELVEGQMADVLALSSEPIEVQEDSLLHFTPSFRRAG